MQRTVIDRLCRLIASGEDVRREFPHMARIVIIGGGPAGYEAALVAAQLDAEVTVIEADGAGGACVLSDCVPSKAFIAASDVVTGYRDTEEFRIHPGRPAPGSGDPKALHAPG